MRFNASLYSVVKVLSLNVWERVKRSLLSFDCLLISLVCFFLKVKRFSKFLFKPLDRKKREASKPIRERLWAAKRLLFA
jgi:hypothetical protein